MKFGRRMAVAEQHVVRALREKRSELAGLVKGLEQELSERRAALMHLDATMRLFDPEIGPEEIGSAQRRRCNAWFCPGECLRLIYDVLRDAPQPVTTREVGEGTAALKGIPVGRGPQAAFVRKDGPASAKRRKESNERGGGEGGGGWQVRQAARARCQ